MLTLALSDIATLGTQVAMHGAIRASEIAGDEIFEMMVAIVIIVYDTAA
jgi:hypothetical protein